MAPAPSRHFPRGSFTAFSSPLLRRGDPCPCGYFGDLKRECRCTPNQLRAYRHRLSGPLLDRIDIHIEVPSVDFRALNRADSGEPSETIRARTLANHDRITADHLLEAVNFRTLDRNLWV